MKSITGLSPFLLLCLFSFVYRPSHSQKAPLIRFESISKVNAWRFGHAYAYNNLRLYITGGETSNLLHHEYETVFVYLFHKNKWEKLNFTSKHFRKSPAYISEFLSEENKIITMGNPIEILDVSNLQLRLIEVEGEYPVQSGSAVWKNKMYLFGGSWASNDKFGKINVFNSFTNRLLSFDQVAFKELAHMPDERNTKGRFIKDKLYVLGGHSLQAEFNDILEYNPETDLWKTVGYLPHSVYNYGITNDDKYIYVAGLHHEKGFLGIYAPATNTYKEYTTNLNLMNGGLVVEGHKLYFFAGSYPKTPTMTEGRLYEFDLTTLPFTPEINCSGN